MKKYITAVLLFSKGVKSKDLKPSKIVLKDLTFSTIPPTLSL